MYKSIENYEAELIPTSVDLPYLRSASLETQSNLMQWAKQYIDSPYVDGENTVNDNAAFNTLSLASSGGLDTQSSSISDIPVLDKPEESELFAKIDDAKLATTRIIIDGFCTANGRDGLFSSEEKDLSVVQSGLLAKQKLIYHNLRLVAWRANYYKLPDGAIMDTDDLISEGVLGLGNAIDKFNPSVGNAFSTYAVLWIRNSMSRAVRSTSRVPEHYQGKIEPLKEHIRDGKSSEEIASELRVTKATVASLVGVLRPPSSLDAPLTKDVSSNMTLGDSIVDSMAETSYDRVDDGSVHENLHDMLTRLTEQQSRVICLRFGIGGSEPMTLDKIGAQEGVTRQRILQIEKLAFRKLREHAKRLGMDWAEHFA